MAMILTDQLTTWREAHPEIKSQPPGPGPYKAKTSKKDRECLQGVVNLTLRREWADLVANLIDDLQSAEAKIKQAKL